MTPVPPPKATERLLFQALRDSKTMPHQSIHSVFPESVTKGFVWASVPNVR